MGSDDDFELFSPSEQPSSTVNGRRLKRLKKATGVSSDGAVSKAMNGQVFDPSEAPELNEQSLTFDSVNELGSEFDGDRLGGETGLGFVCGEDEDEGTEKREEIGVLKVGESLDFEESNEEPLRFDSVNEVNFRSDEGQPRTKRVLEFDGNGEGPGGERGVEIEDLKVGKSEKKRGMGNSEDSSHEDGPSGEMEEGIEDLMVGESEKKRGNSEDLSQRRVKRKKRSDRVSDDGKPDACASPRKMTEKERRAHLSQLHAETQRLLRETRDASFKPAKPVQKPISSILEKIRQRKLEVLQKTVTLNYCSVAHNNSSLREISVDLDSEDGPIDNREDGEFAKVVNEDIVGHPANVVGNGYNESANHLSQENTPSQMDSEEKAKHAFRAPIDGTQDLFCDSEASDLNNELPNEHPSSLLEETLKPSLLAMNLKLDSVPADDATSDEEDNDKENIDPGLHRPSDSRSSPQGDPVKAFVDDEAEEEDDSDNDLFRFQENEEDEDNGESEELNDLIATEYEEKPIDGERRNQLHQQWLEQQDAAGTDNLLQRLKCGSEQRETAILEDEGDEEEEEEEDDCGYEAAEGLDRTNNIRINLRKLKEMIPQMFTDKDDGFLSSDDEETEKRLVKQRLLQKAEEQATLLSPGKDESSREIFGLIKKLNVVPDTKKKAKPSSVLGTLLQGRNSNNSSKSSFLGRASNRSLPSSHKHGSSMARSFVFGRDDSNSRGSVSMSEDSSNKIEKETRPIRSGSAKFSSSQSKFSSTHTQKTQVAVEKTSGTSLFEVLRRSSSLQSNHCTEDNLAGQNQSVFAALRLTKKSIKVEGRS